MPDKAAIENYQLRVTNYEARFAADDRTSSLVILPLPLSRLRLDTATVIYSRCRGWFFYPGVPGESRRHTMHATPSDPWGVIPLRENATKQRCVDAGTRRALIGRFARFPKVSRRATIQQAFDSSACPDGSHFNWGKSRSENGAPVPRPRLRLSRLVASVDVHGGRIVVIAYVGGRVPDV